MKKNHFLFVSTLAVIFLNCSAPVTVHERNASIYVEPGIYIAYDNTVFKGQPASVGGRPDGTDAIEFKLIKGATGKTTIFIDASENISIPPNANQDSLMELHKFNTDFVDETGDKRITSFDKKIRYVRGFSCYGLTMYSKTENLHHTTISGMRLYENANSWFWYGADNQNNLEDAYKVLDSLFAGWTYKGR